MQTIAICTIRFNRNFGSTAKSLLGDFVKILGKGSDLNTDTIYCEFGYDYEVSINEHNSDLNSDIINVTRGDDSVIRGE